MHQLLLSKQRATISEEYDEIPSADHQNATSITAHHAQGTAHINSSRPLSRTHQAANHRTVASKFHRTSQTPI